MNKHNCENCTFREKFDKNPRSLLGRLWKWHIGWCPGWKGYITSLPSDERITLAEKYDLKKYSRP
ncbi:MAG: hypothetical protein KJO26_14920 [Deltaproteobacteria bacterium]|nr:hypothetical protein [Deltaproteobacteria bacterium]